MEPVYQWVEDDIWGLLVREQTAWRLWWILDSPTVVSAMQLLIDKMVEFFDMAQKEPPEEVGGIASWWERQLYRSSVWINLLWQTVTIDAPKIFKAISDIVAVFILDITQGLLDGLTLLSQFILGDWAGMAVTSVRMIESMEQRFSTVGTTIGTILEGLAGGAFKDFGEEVGKVGKKVRTWFSEMGKKSVTPPITENFSSMTTAVETHFGKVLPMYTQESIWLGITIPKAGKTLKDSQVDDIWPGITGAVTSSFSSILPSFMQIARWEGITIPLAGTVLQAAMERGWASILLSVNLAWAGMLLDFEEMEVWFLVTLPDALVILEELFEVKMTLIYDYIYKVHEYWGGFANSVKSFWRWLQNRTFVINVDVNVPPEGELGSPLKIHTAWMAFEKYLGHTIFEPRLALTGVSGSMGRAETTHVYIESLRIEGVQDARDLLRQLQEMV